MTSAFGSAFDKLPSEIQQGIFQALKIRRMKYIQALGRGYIGDIKFVIIGDTPGPGRPNTPNYHHTPFYSTKNSSLWLNKQLIENDISEKDLLWFNAKLANGNDLDGVHVQDLLTLTKTPIFIVLGGNAEKWFKSVAPTIPYKKVYHPAYAKRFHSKEPYELIKILKGQ